MEQCPQLFEHTLGFTAMLLSPSPKHNFTVIFQHIGQLWDQKRDKLFYMEVVKLKNCLKLNCQEMNQRNAAAPGVNVMGIPFLVNQVFYKPS